MFRANCQEAVIRVYRSGLLGRYNHKIFFDVFDEQAMDFTDKAYAFATPEVAVNLHRHHRYRVRFNGKSKVSGYRSYTRSAAIPLVQPAAIAITTSRARARRSMNSTDGARPVARQLGRISKRRTILLWRPEFGRKTGGNYRPCFNGNMNIKTKIKAPECLCGCGGHTKGGRFLPGHDAKLKKALVADARAGKKRAKNKLEKLGWSKFLTLRTEVAVSEAVVTGRNLL